MASDRKFFTNEGEETLAARFGKLIPPDTQNFDALVGYFYISGFHRLHDALDGVEKIRILIGLNTDSKTRGLIESARQVEDLFPDPQTSAQVKAGMPELFRRDLEKGDDTPEVESGVQRFLAWLKSKKLDIRVYKEQPLHAKVYIMTFKKGNRYQGCVITGSSNFSESGLVSQLEFNVELRDDADHTFALEQFNKLWAKSVDVSPEAVSTIEKASPYSDFTPYELYLKLLLEYFRDELVQTDELKQSDLPDGFKKLLYQEEAVHSALRILNLYNGVFLSDVVGLGKTYMAALLARELDGHMLVIAPPGLLDENNPGSWKNVFANFNIGRAKFASVGKLDDVLEWDLSKITTVFIDESHRFRTDDNQTYEMLARICRGRRVVLVSATPLNNTPLDILSQIKLFRSPRSGGIHHIHNLEQFFNRLEKRLEETGGRMKNPEGYLRVIQENAREIREKVLKFLMVRRTRSEIVNYYGADMKAQGLSFPDVADPAPLYYEFSPNESRIFAATLDILGNNFSYARYQPLMHYRGTEFSFETQGQVNMVRFIRTMLIKRMESSVHAFRQTLVRFIKSHDRVIEQFDNGWVYTGKHYGNKIYELLEEGELDEVDRLLSEGKIQKLPAKDFDKTYRGKLDADRKQLRYILKEWEQIRRDPKWNAFRKALTERSDLKKAKLVIFSESRETAEYLWEKISKEVEPRVIVYSGLSDPEVRHKVTANFDANHHKPQDDYRILITTDVLAEGVNLHRSGVVINYDLPWNPTRMIQRVGRINRVGTKFKKILTFNFFPTDEGEEAIGLKNAAINKIQAFIEMLGNDARLLTDGEEIKSHDLFDRLTSKTSLTGEDEDQPSELEFLSEIRRIRDENPALYGRVKALPRKARSSHVLDAAAEVKIPGVLTYFRQGKLDKFFLDAKPGASVELDFMAAARLVKTTQDEPRHAIETASYYAALEANKSAFAAATAPGSEGTDAGHRSKAKGDQLLRFLNTTLIRSFKDYDEDDLVFLAAVRDQLRAGEIPKAATKKAMDAVEKLMDPTKILLALRKHIAPEYLRPADRVATRHDQSPRQVILSSCLLAATDRK